MGEMINSLAGAAGRCLGPVGVRVHGPGPGCAVGTQPRQRRDGLSRQSSPSGGAEGL